MNELEIAKHQLRMEMAALRQFLRNRSEAMTNEEKNGVLDKLGVLVNYLRAIEDYEKKKGK